jgi:hypothetical protein
LDEFRGNQVNSHSDGVELLAQLTALEQKKEEIMAKLALSDFEEKTNGKKESWIWSRSPNSTRCAN